MIEDKYLYAGLWDSEKSNAEGIGIKIRERTGSLYEGQFQEGKA